MDKVDISAKAYRKKLAANGVFYSDDKMAQLIRAELGDVTEVYDPTCGNGSLLRAFGDEVKKYGQELDASQLEYCRNTLTNFKGYTGDTLKDNGFADRRFMTIAANPPFSVSWIPNGDDPRFSVAPALVPSKADWAFVLHCLYMLKDGGTAAILCFPGICYRGNSEGKIRKWICEQGVVKKVIHIEGGYFADTKITTTLLVLKKSKGSGSIEMIDHATGVGRVVPMDEIAQNDYNLSVNQYITQEVNRNEVDVIGLEMKARNSMVKALHSSIEMSAMFQDDTLMPLSSYLDDLEAVIVDARKMYCKKQPKIKDTTVQRQLYLF